MGPSTAGAGAGIVTDHGTVTGYLKQSILFGNLGTMPSSQFQSILENEIEFSESWEKNPGVLAFHLLYVSRR